eukprot:TRINITY_DN69878_c0_g1_i1.p1 TRINITY_DN69878_c0_g1~~TRINITY_DN69878_c0_g1_i1.p1  ORF type:complete len:151 (-),score=13.55 TRINITY_DN69878_c0_g1_i1:7-459(-)
MDSPCCSKRCPPDRYSPILFFMNSARQLASSQISSACGDCSSCPSSTRACMRAWPNRTKEAHARLVRCCGNQSLKVTCNFIQRFLKANNGIIYLASSPSRLARLRVLLSPRPAAACAMLPIKTASCRSVLQGSDRVFPIKDRKASCRERV